MVEHLCGTLRVGANQSAQVGQRVEQHVRFKLGFEQFELRLGRLALDFGQLFFLVKVAYKPKADGD